MDSSFFNFQSYHIPEDAITAIDSNTTLEVMVIVYQSDLEKHSALLYKIFSAVGINLENHPGLLELEKGQQTNAQRHSSTDTKQVISFGISPSNLGLNGVFSGYNIYQTETFKLLLSHSLAQLAEKKERKKALWDALQQMF